MALSAPGTPSERIDDFYMQIGRCIAGWAEIDEWLFRLCRESIGPYEQSAIVYYRTPGIDIRLGLVDELVKSILPKRSRKSGGHDHPDVKLWKGISSDIRKLLSTRRRIAHHPVKAITNFLLLFTYPEKYGGANLQIQASEYERLRQKDADISPLAISDLMMHAIATDEIGQKLERFYDVLTEHVSASHLPTTPRSPAEHPSQKSSIKPRRRRKSSPL